jgi:hypothetical protein
LRLLDAKELTHNITIVMRLKRNDDTHPPSHGELKVFARCGGPIPVLQQLLDRSKHGTILGALAIAKGETK